MKKTTYTAADLPAGYRLDTSYVANILVIRPDGEPMLNRFGNAISHQTEHSAVASALRSANGLYKCSIRCPNCQEWYTYYPLIAHECPQTEQASSIEPQVAVETQEEENYRIHEAEIADIAANRAANDAALAANPILAEQLSQALTPLAERGQNTTNQITEEKGTTTVKQEKPAQFNQYQQSVIDAVQAGAIISRKEQKPTGNKPPICYPMTDTAGKHMFYVRELTLNYLASLKFIETTDGGQTFHAFTGAGGAQVAEETPTEVVKVSAPVETQEAPAPKEINLTQGQIKALQVMAKGAILKVRRLAGTVVQVELHNQSGRVESVSLQMFESLTRKGVIIGTDTCTLSETGKNAIAAYIN